MTDYLMDEGSATRKAFPFVKILGVFLVFILVWSLGNAVLAVAQVESADSTMATWQPETQGQGFSAWVARISAGNSSLYGVLVIVVMAVMGSILGFVMDLLIRRTGINLGRLKHRE